MTTAAPHPHAAALARLLLAVADEPTALDNALALVAGDPDEVGRIVRADDPTPAEGGDDGTDDHGGR